MRLPLAQNGNATKFRGGDELSFAGKPWDAYFSTCSTILRQLGRAARNSLP